MDEKCFLSLCNMKPWGCRLTNKYRNFFQNKIYALSETKKIGIT